MRKFNLFQSRMAAVVTGSAVIVGLGATGAVAADAINSRDVANGSIRGVDIANGTIDRSEIRDNSLGVADLSPFVRNQLFSNERGEVNKLQAQVDDLGAQVQGNNGLRGDVTQLNTEVDTLAAELGESGTLAGHESVDWTVVTNIGGSIVNRKTDLVTVNLRPGTYMVNVDGAFIYPTGTTPHAGTDLYPQLSLWVDANDNGEMNWQTAEGSISPNALMPAMVERHVSVSGSTVLTITEDQVVRADGTVPVKVSAFGYDTSQGTAGAGQLHAAAELNVVEVQLPEVETDTTP